MDTKETEAELSAGITYWKRSQVSEDDLKQYISQGEGQLQQVKETKLTCEEETQACHFFYQWADNTDVVKVVSTPLELAWIPDGWKAFMLDYAPRSSRGDDFVYSNNHKVWRKVPRGCAMLKVIDPKGDTHYRWAVRANRKFTGHEDEGDVGDVKLYGLEGEAERAVVTLKENGMVLHLAGRRLQFSCAGHDDWNPTLLFMGSKKVHVAIPWDASSNNIAQDLSNAIAEYGTNLRYSIVSKMVNAIAQSVSPAQIEFVMNNQVVLNAEFLVPSGSGPINNAFLHDLKTPTPYMFSMVPNMEEMPDECGLCIEPVFALHKLQDLGFHVVDYCVFPVDQLDRVKAEIAKLPDIEGAVVYHVTKEGRTLSLEKAKAGGYVIIRAIREKSKRFVFGSKSKPGLSWLVSDIKSAIQDCKVTENEEDDTKAEFPFVVQTSEPRNYLYSFIQDECNGRRVNPTKWLLGKQPRPEDLQEFVLSKRRNEIIQKLISAQRQVTGRIQQIDHVPIADQERAEWIIYGQAFTEYIFRQILNGADATEFFDHYSGKWTLFYNEYTADPSRYPSPNGSKGGILVHNPFGYLSDDSIFKQDDMSIDEKLAQELIDAAMKEAAQEVKKSSHRRGKKRRSRKKNKRRKGQKDDDSDTKSNNEGKNNDDTNNNNKNINDNNKDSNSNSNTASGEK